jgi:Fe-S oxidoreductase
MWFDNAPIGPLSGMCVQEILATGADTIAVGCSFCPLMITDGVAAEPEDGAVRDIAEVLCDALEN